MTEEILYPPDSKVQGDNMGPTWVLSAPDRSHVGPMNLAIRECHDTSGVPFIKKVPSINRTGVLFNFNHSMISNYIHYKAWDEITIPKLQWCNVFFSPLYAGIILCMCPANERHCYNVMPSLIGWKHTWNGPWCTKFALQYIGYLSLCQSHCHDELLGFDDTAIWLIETDWSWYLNNLIVWCCCHSDPSVWCHVPSKLCTWLQYNLILNYCLLTHWGRVTHICVSKLIIIGSDNGLAPGQRQAIIWTNAGKLIIGPLGTNFGGILIEILTLSFMKMRLKVSSVKRRPFFLGLNVLNHSHSISIDILLIQLHDLSCYDNLITWF